MSYTPIDYTTPRNSLIALFPPGGPAPVDPYNAVTLIAMLGEFGALYDTAVADCNAAVARNAPPIYELTPAARDTALTPTSAATTPGVTQLNVVDFLTRLVTQANRIVAAYPWVAGHAPPAGYVTGWPWL